MKLIDAEELGYRITDSPYPRGEICVRSPAMAMGYWKQKYCNFALSSFAFLLFLLSIAYLTFNSYAREQIGRQLRC